ncbi:hypothetical protein EVAR_38156_1 [Eumeta japonica]|uniref:Uncharacterized protein n=1 Tax=Eumeta variegata TaxID=151549 RepID=A0A4C1ZIK4_EUMVA|nr:hypothetical protein EVAR_38156_1 [Eumeta japonica]
MMRFVSPERVTRCDELADTMQHLPLDITSIRNEPASLEAGESLTEGCRADGPGRISGVSGRRILHTGRINQNTGFKWMHRTSLCLMLLTSLPPVLCCARGRPIIVEWERDARHSAGLSLVRGYCVADSRGGRPAAGGRRRARARARASLPPLIMLYARSVDFPQERRLSYAQF